MKQTNHIHRFKRHIYKTGGQIYYCINDCNFRVAVEFALGKVSECNRCGRPFKMNKYSITLDKPHCEECHVYKGDKITNKKKEIDKPIQPLSVVSDSLGREIVNDLKDRMSSLLTAKVDEIESSSEIDNQAKTVEIREFKLEDEEFL